MQRIPSFSKVLGLLCSFSLFNMLVDIFGRLEGENIVGSVIQDTPNVWCLPEPLWSRSAASIILGKQSSSHFTVPATPTTSQTGQLVHGWKEPIYRMTRNTLDMNICFSSILPTDFSHNYPPAQDPTLPSPTSNPIVGNPPIDTTQSRPIPIQPSPVAELSSRSPTFPSPETLLELPSHLTPTQAPPPPLPISLPPLEPAIPTPRAESQEEPALIADTLPGTMNVTTISPLHDVSNRKPHPDGFKAGDPVGSHPSQFTNPGPEDEDLSEGASTTVASTSQTPKWKKRKWYQRVLGRR